MARFLGASRTSPHQRRWPASLAVIAIMIGQLALPTGAAWGSRWLLPGIETLLLAPLLVTNPVRLRSDLPWLRVVAIVLSAAVLMANAVTLLRLVVLISQDQPLTGATLVRVAAVVLATNVVATAIVLWEMDRGGPFARDHAHARDEEPPDLLFPQTTVDGRLKRWRPAFIDYLFVGFTCSTAFSPTDTLPLTPRAKLVFIVSGTVAVSSLAIVAARAVNLV